MTYDPPSLSESPEWATGLARIDYHGGLDLRPYYWVSKDKYQRCTSKNTTRKFGGSNQHSDNMIIIKGTMTEEINMNLCFGAKWISPASGLPVTALHFSSFVDVVRKHAWSGYHPGSNFVKIKPVVGNKYLCLANDIVSSWQVELTYLGEGQWSHETENVDGEYPCIVDEVITELWSK